MNRFRKLKRSGNCVYIYRGKCLEVIIYSPDEILDESLVQSPGEDSHWSLYCLTKTGSVYRVCQSRTKISKSQPREEDQDIFSDLLNVESEEDEFGIPLQFTTKPVYVLQSCDLIMHLTDNVVGLAVTNNLISVLINNSHAYSVFISEISEKFEESLHMNKQSKCLKFTKMYQIQEGQRQVKHLLKIAAVDNKSEDHVHSTDLIQLDVDLFNALFGKDAVILNMAVVLLCLPEGSVYFAQTNLFEFRDFHQTDDKGSVLDTSSSVSKATDSGWKLLCGTASPVTDIVQVSLEQDLTESANRTHVANILCTHTLIVCCKGGLVLAFVVKKDGSPAVVLSELVLTSPVVSVASFCNRLYHCTGRQLYEKSLSLKTNGEGTKPNVTISGTKTFQYAHLERLSCDAEEGFNVCQGSPCLLICATDNGQMVEIRSTDFGEDVCPVTGGQIRDVLLSLEKVDAERQVIQKELQEQDYHLQQINIAVSLIKLNFFQAPKRSSGYSVSETLRSSNEKVLLSCMPSTMLYANNGEKEIQFAIEITNESQLSFSCDWTFIVKVLQSEEVLSQMRVVSVSQILKEELKHRDSLSITVTVQPELVLSGFTADVTAVLGLTNTGTSKTLSDAQCLSALVHSEEIDVLYFLLPNTFKRRDLCVDKSHWADISKHIQKVAELKPMAKLLKDDFSQESLSSKAICVSHRSHMTNDAYVQLQSQYGQGLVCILKYLLQNSPSVPVPSGQDCSVLTVLGQVVYLSVSNMSSIAMETEVNSVHVEVKVRSEPSAAAAVHSAIMRRMKSFECGVGHPSIPLREMKKNLHKIQELEEELQTMSKMHVTRQNFGEVTGLYERLRSLDIF